jgi:molecular chaperone DnaK
MDRQQAIRIVVFQGDDKYFKNNVKLGEFVLGGIEQARRGVPQIEVVFDIDQSGLFMVSARDLKTNVKKEVKIEGVASSN